MPNEMPEPLGNLYIDHRIISKPQWMVDQLLKTCISELNIYKPCDIFVSPSPSREGDFSVLIQQHKFDPIIVEFLAVPGQGRSTVIFSVFTK